MTIELQQDELRGFLVGLEITGQRGVLDIDSSLEELGLLADTAGIHVVGQTYQRVKHPDPATFIRKGKVEEVHHWVEELGVGVVVLDDELSPRHQRELEKEFGEEVRVLDRTALILDIFAQHAHTREGSLQVELAQYVYRLPRLTRQWTHLVRQAGGGGARGVGLRGPGETQLETDRREIGRRIARLRREIEEVRAHRERHRAQRRRSGISVVGLVGYTNAGKSTLLNQVSGASVHVADQLFATLDPTTRRVELPSGRGVLFTDTVGFIQKLPHSLIAAFRATLEEVTEADLLLHVVDCSHPNAVEHMQVVGATLVDELGIEDAPILVVLNKVDRLTESAEFERLQALRENNTDAITISALTGYGITDMLDSLDNSMNMYLVNIIVRIPYTESKLLARFYEIAEVKAENHTEEYVELTGVIAPRYTSYYEAYRVK